MGENFSKALDFMRPRVDSWTKELLRGVEALNLSKPQKDLVQGMTVETMLFNTMMPNEEIIAILSGIIRNIATKHSYAQALDWGKREEMYRKYSEKQG